MEDSQNRILEGAFKLFLSMNYEKVTVPALEEEIGLTRGSIFYKTKNKDKLFQKVIETYVFNKQSVKNKFPQLAFTTFKEFIDEYLNRVENTMQSIIALGIRNPHRAYFNLLYQALQYYPGFDKKITEIFQAEIPMWENEINKGIISGEILPSIDAHLTAKKFRYIYSGLSFESSLLNGLKKRELKELYYSYYQEIKNGK